MPFQIAGGSVAGRDHVLLGRNNQDAFCWSATEHGVVAVVADGCGSGRLSEVGAQIGARLAAESLRALLPRLDDGEPRLVLERVRLDVLAQLRVLAGAMGGSLSGTVSEYFLFTILGFAFTARRTIVFGIGDGCLAVNGERRLLTATDNAPAYLAYGLVPSTLSDAAPAFQIHADLPTPDVETLLVGTDGVGEVPELAEFWQPRAFAN